MYCGLFSIFTKWENFHKWNWAYSEFTPGFFGGSVLLIFLVFCVVLLRVFTFWVSCCDVRYDYRIKTMLIVLCGRARVIYVICVCLRIVVSNTYCVVFFFVLCTLCCQFLWIILFRLSLRYSLTFITNTKKLVHKR